MKSKNELEQIEQELGQALADVMEEVIIPGMLSCNIKPILLQLPDTVKNNRGDFIFEITHKKVDEKDSNIVESSKELH